LLWTGSKESVFAIKMVDSPVTTKNYCVIVAYPSAVSKEVSLQRTLMLFEKLGNTERINLSTIRSVISSIFFILDTLFNVKNITSSKDSYKFEPFKCFLSIFTQKKNAANFLRILATVVQLSTTVLLDEGKIYSLYNNSED